MTSLSAGSVAPPRGFRFGRHRGLIVAIVVFAILMAINALMSHGGLSYFDISSMATGGAPLAIAATGQTLVILTGGFDLSAGAVISLVNVVLANNMPDTPSGILVWSLLTSSFRRGRFSPRPGSGDHLRKLGTSGKVGDQLARLAGSPIEFSSRRIRSSRRAATRKSAPSAPVERKPGRRARTAFPRPSRCRNSTIISAQIWRGCGSPHPRCRRVTA